MARIPTPCACKYRIVVQASTPSTPSGPPHGRWSTRARLPDRLGLVSGDGWVLFQTKSTTPVTVSETSFEIPIRLDFEARAADFYKAVVHLDRAATKQLDQVGFAPRLRE